MKSVSTQDQLNKAIASGEAKIEITGEWNKLIIREGVKIDSLKILKTAKVGSVYIYGTAKVGRVDIYGTVTGSVDIYGTAKVGKGFESTRSDYFDVLKMAIREVPSLIEALKKGKINGSVYAGDCVCLVGTLEKARGTGANSVIERDIKRPAFRKVLWLSSNLPDSGISESRTDALTS